MRLNRMLRYAMPRCRRLTRLCGGEAGLAAIELAILAPVLGVVLIGAIDYGTVFTRQSELANAVRAGTQFATIKRPSLNDPNPTAETYNAVVSALPANYSGTAPDVQLFCECPDGSGGPSCTAIDCGVDAGGNPIDEFFFISISVQENIPLILKYPGVFPNPYPATEAATMRLR